MTFKPEMLAKVLSGEKTQTRRAPDQPNCPYNRGQDYAIQPGRGKHGLNGRRLHVTNTRRERVRDISTPDARAEGFESRESYLAYFASMYPGRNNPFIWVIDFHVINARGERVHG